MKILPAVFLLLLLPAATGAAPVTVNAVGDIMLAGSGERTFRKLGYDNPFAATTEILRRADVVIGNLEAPIAVTGAEFTAKKFRFRLSPLAAPALKNAGFTHLSLANNHILDFGEDGLRQTLEALAREGLACSGAGRNLAAAREARIVEVRGVRIALLSYSLVYPEEFFATSGKAGTAPGYAPLFTVDIKRAKEVADYVVVSFHWGGEGLIEPKPYQKTAGHRAIDAGADIVIGHHPHVLQGVEFYRNGVIFYSLGNFAFGSLSSNADRSIIARITLDGGIKEVEVIPLNVLNREVSFQPRPLQGKSAVKAISSLERLSQPLGSSITAINGRYLVYRKTSESALPLQASVNQPVSYSRTPPSIASAPRH
jgi:poly-gamma-glutamate synthesis protein (capsule biosynthesis protein)